MNDLDVKKSQNSLDSVFRNHIRTDLMSIIFTDIFNDADCDTIYNSITINVSKEAVLEIVRHISYRFCDEIMNDAIISISIFSDKHLVLYLMARTLYMFNQSIGENSEIVKTNLIANKLNYTSNGCKLFDDHLFKYVLSSMCTILSNKITENKLENYKEMLRAYEDNNKI